MLDAVGNVLKDNDIVMCALGASYNQNNSSLTPCRILEIRGNRCRVQTCYDVVTKHNKMSTRTNKLEKIGNKYQVVSHTYCWKFPRQVVKIEKFITKI